MSLSVSLQGINEAISNLNYRNGRSSKAKLLEAVRAIYANASAVGAVKEIPAEDIILGIWGPCDPALIKSRRKNLSTLRSSVNADLLRLLREGKNPDGIVLSPANVFVMSDEAKDHVLEQFKDSVRTGEAMTMSRITEVLELINGLLAEPGRMPDGHAPDGIARLRELVTALSREAGLDATQPQGAQTQGTQARIEPSKWTGVPSTSTGGNGLAAAEEASRSPVGFDPQVGGERRTAVEDRGSYREEHGGDGTPSEETVDQMVEQEETIEEEVEVAEEDEPFEELELLEEDEILEEPEGAEQTNPSGGTGDRASLLAEVGDMGGPRGTDAEGSPSELPQGTQAGGRQELGLPFSACDEDWGSYRTEEQQRDAKLLAEAFDGFLGAMDRYYNQYLLIPEGEYNIGPPRLQGDHGPQAKVRLAPFYMGKFPVTNALFEIFVEKTGYRTTAEREGYGLVYEGRSKKMTDPATGLQRVSWKSALACRKVEGACWHRPSGPGSNLFRKRNHPVAQVTFEDALAFAAWTGKRLPTEEEWEAAARTAKARTFPWGDTWTDGASNIEEYGAGDTTAVDAFEISVNVFGIADTLGNVLEWTATQAGDEGPGSRSKVCFVAKGGSWVSGRDLALWSRFPVEADTASNILGFRCVAQ